MGSGVFVWISREVEKGSNSLLGLYGWFGKRSVQKKEVFIWISREQPERKTHLRHDIEATDRQIDQLVYELYGLTEEEIKIVEDATTK